jgi:tripartite-type tricarboxylate transporter receptor subunit TctC
VPYKGVAPLLNDLMGGQIDMAFLPMAGSIMQTVADGAVYASLQNPEVRKDLEATGNAVMSPRSPAELATLYQQETERYRALAKSINLQPQAQ